MVTSSWALVASIRNTESEYCSTPRWKRKTIKTEMCHRKNDYHHDKALQKEGWCWPVSVFTTQGIRTFTSKRSTHALRLNAQNILQSSRVVSTPNLVLGEGSESDYVGKHALGESNKRGSWMKQWLMIQNFVALNSKFKTRTRNGRKVFARVLDARSMRRQGKQAKLTCSRNEPTNLHEDMLNLRTGSQNKHAVVAPNAKKNEKDETTEASQLCTSVAAAKQKEVREAEQQHMTTTA